MGREKTVVEDTRGVGELPTPRVNGSRR